MEFRVLGPVEMGPVDAPVALRGHRRRGVLAVLLLRANRVVSTAELVQTLWAEPTPAAESNVRTQVTELRRLLDKHDDMPGRLVTEASGYRLAVGPDEVDLAVFEELAAEGEEALRQGAVGRAVELLTRARGLWRGPALDGTSSSTALAAEADRLEERRLAVTELWAEAAIGAGRAGEAVAELRSVVAANPVREGATALLMTALAEAGEPAAALTAYQDVRAVLVERLGTDPSPDLLRLYERILRNEPVREPTGGTSTVPRQLPAVPAGFTGRQAELDTLTHRLDDAASDGGTVVISAIGGMAGIGKTSLAVYWAHQIADRFTDGQLFVNLRGFASSGAAPVSPTEALRGLLDAFGVPPERIPASLDAQAALYRSLIAGKKLLILLDNARDERQVRPLLPGAPGCLVLVTSRHRLTGLITAEGAAPLALDVLTDADARDLLARRLGVRRVGAEPAAVDRIVELCARLPLALAIVAARAAEHPDLSLDTLAGQLRDGRDRLDALDSGDDEATNLRAVFSWSYRALSDDAARLFRLLGQHPGPTITAPAAASLTAMPDARVQRLLDELVRANLIAEHGHTPRYGLHDLLRTYAAELAHQLDTEAERRAATDRMLDHYLHTAHTADRILNPARDPIDIAAPAPGAQPENPTTAANAMDWFTHEHPVLLAALDHASAIGAHTHTWQLAWALANFLDRQGHWNDWVTTHRAAVTAAGDLGDHAAEARMRSNLASAYTELGDFDEAHVHLRRVLELATQADDQGRQADAHLSLGRMWEQQNRADLALNDARQALALFRMAGDRRGEALALNAVGFYLGMLGDYEQTLTSCEQALELHQERDDRIGQAATWDSLGYARHHLGHHQQALACYQHALGLYGELGDRYAEGDILVHLGDTHHAIGDLPAARDVWRRALAVFTDLGHPDADAVRAKLAALERRD